MTPCEKLGYKVGDRFEVTKGNGYFCEGEIVSLTYDDGSSFPEFSNGKKVHYKALSNVRTIMRTQQLPPPNPIEYLKSAHANGDIVDPETMLRECYGIAKTERVVPEWSDVKRDIKVGDRVRIIGPASYTDQSKFFGEIKTVFFVDADSENATYDIGPLGCGYSFWFPASSVELV